MCSSILKFQEHLFAAAEVAYLKKIMIIDDDVCIGDMLEELLTKENYSTVRAYSGTEALLYLSSHRPDLILLDEPTNHLDMEAITALNNGLIKFPGVLIFSSRDHQIVQTTANRIMEIVNGQLIDKITTYDEYLASDEMARKRQTYSVQTEEED